MSKQPVGVTLNDGILIWLEYEITEDRERLVLRLDKRPQIYAEDVQNLPRGPTKKMVPEICRSTVDEIMEESYKSVTLISCSILTLSLNV